jgi:hypothetical protein
MSYNACTQRNQVDSQLLMVGNQTSSLTPDLSFDNDLCFRCPNGQCEPILHICVSITFQWYNELFKPMGFNPCNRALKIWESIRNSNSYNGSSLRNVRVHSLTLFALPKACDVTLESFFWHSQEHVMWFPNLFLGPQPCNPLLRSQAQV